MDVDETLMECSRAFDYYLQHSTLPDDYDDAKIGHYLERTLALVPQLVVMDPLWQQILKDDIMKFIRALVESFDVIDNPKPEPEEDKPISVFDERKNRILEILKYKTIPVFDINDINLWELPFHPMADEDDDYGIVESHNQNYNMPPTGQPDKQRQKEVVADQLLDEWHSNLKYLHNDFETRRSYQAEARRYPIVDHIVKIMGRGQGDLIDDVQTVIERMTPKVKSKIKSATPYEEVVTGSQLTHLLPIEYAMLGGVETDDLFYLKYAISQLQMLASYPPTTEEVPQDSKKKSQRRDKGPIIVAIDTSASMHGWAEKVAKAMLFQLLDIAKRQNRSCFLISFSVRAKTVDLTKPGNWGRAEHFLNCLYSGGNDFTPMFKNIFSTLESGDYECADALAISDFEVSPPKPDILESMKAHQAKGSRFYGLRLGQCETEYERCLDQLWTISRK